MLNTTVPHEAKLLAAFCVRSMVRYTKYRDAVVGATLVPVTVAGVKISVPDSSEVVVANVTGPTKLLAVCVPIAGVGVMEMLCIHVRPNVILPPRPGV